MPDQVEEHTDSIDRRQFDASEIDSILALYGFKPVTSDRLAAFHALSDSLIEGEIAPPELLAAVQDRTQRSLHMRWSPDGEPDAILASIPLTASGRYALINGRFGFGPPRDEWMAAPGEKAAALQSWGIAGRTAAGRAAAARGLVHGWSAIYRDVPVYTRARSKEGRAFMTRLGFRPVGGERDGDPLFISTGLPAAFRRLGRVDTHIPPSAKGEAA